MATDRAAGAARIEPWLGGRSFDLVWFSGGAVLAFAAFAVAVAFRPSIVAIAWIWLLLFDGPHMMALYTRTYLDAETWRANKPLLVGALAAFAVGPAFLAATLATHDDRPFLAFLGLSSVYGYHHVVRQHYGFVALYRGKGGVAPARATFLADKWTLYLGLWLPWLHFLVAHPVGRALVGAAPEASGAERAAGAALLGAWLVIALGYAVVTLVGRPRRGLESRYLLLVVGVHGFLYFVASRFEPVYSAARTPDQQLLLMTVMGGIVHSAQYVGIVWLYHARTRAGASLPRYLLACVAFSAIYLVIAAATAVYPAITLVEAARVGPFPVSRLALCVWWGIALHHYVIDQRIWRLRSDPTLRAKLAL
jgi:hypothetical protein